MFGYLVFENVILAMPSGVTHARTVVGAVGVGSITTVTSAHPPARAPRQSRIDVLFRPSGHAPFMSNVEYLPVRTSDGSVVLSVVVLTPLERLRRFLKRL